LNLVFLCLGAQRLLGVPNHQDWVHAKKARLGQGKDRTKVFENTNPDRWIGLGSSFALAH
jgi:hypothetical protein